MNTPQLQNLPRLLYISDVPVESSYHGSALLYRLLQDYPRDRLLIIEGGIFFSLPERRLQDVRYATLGIRYRRLLHTRFASWYSSWLLCTAAYRVRQVEALMKGFQPNAVLTVAHGYGCMTAAQLATVYGIPLHLICHDDWPKTVSVIGIMKNRLEENLGAIYKQAASRFCVSPFMCEEYHKRYNSEGTVLYPSRAAACTTFKTPPKRLARNDHPFTVAFGGTINSPGYVRGLIRLATVLKAVKGRLLIFGPLTAEDAYKIGLVRENIILGGLVTSAELVTRFREEVDALFVPMSFDASDRANMEVGFPSKLTDYTAVGLPLIIYGPVYCSAVRWAQENLGVATIVTEEDGPALATAIQRLAEEPSVRIALGEQALEVGRRYFSYEAVQHVFSQGLGQQEKLTA